MEWAEDRSAVFLVDKQAGNSSAKEIAILKRKLALKKVGHVGTLDPFATGLLVVVVNNATRLASFAEAGTKSYQGEIQFGVLTNSDDITGEVLETRPVEFTQRDLDSQLKNFIGEIQQIPPKISAIKIGGKKAYEMVRSGQSFEVPVRKVRVYSFETELLTPDRLFFNISCSKGTYIRAIARDLGLALGCGATLASLRRTASAPFNVAAAKKVEQIELKDAICCSAIVPEAFKLGIEDEKVLADLSKGKVRALEQVSNQIPGDKSIAMYVDGAGRPAGLVTKSAGVWKFAANNL